MIILLSDRPGGDPASTADAALCATKVWESTQCLPRVARASNLYLHLMVTQYMTAWGVSCL